MKIECDRVRLQEALGLISAAVPSQSTTPIALDVLIQAGENGIRLQGTDLTLFAEARVLEVKEVTDGEALIPVARLVGLVREMTSGTIVIRRDPGQFSVEIAAGNDSFRIVGHDPGDFPQPPAASECPGVVLETGTVAEALRTVSFAAARDISRQQLQGVAVIMEGKKVHFAASDGKRLAEYATHVGVEAERRREGMVPLRAIEVIERLVGIDVGEVEIRLDPEAQQIAVRHDRGQVLCRLLQGQMPDYVSMIPTEFDSSVEGPARDLLAAVRKAAVLTTKDNAMVTLEAAGGKLLVRVASQDVGSGVIGVENVTANGADISASFTVPFLSDGLRVLGDNVMKLGLQKGRGAAVMQSGRSFRYAFMPVIPHGADL